MKAKGNKIINSYFAKNVIAINYCISITPLNMLSNTQKEFFEYLNSWLLQDGHGWPHQHPADAEPHKLVPRCWREIFRYFFLGVALHSQKSDVKAPISFCSIFCIIIILKISYLSFWGRSAYLAALPRKLKFLHTSIRYQKKSFWATMMGCCPTSCPNLKA